MTTLGKVQNLDLLETQDWDSGFETRDLAALFITFYHVYIYIKILRLQIPGTKGKFVMLPIL